MVRACCFFLSLSLSLTHSHTHTHTHTLVIATHPTLLSLEGTRPPYEQTVSGAHAPDASPGQWSAWPTTKADYYRRSTRAEQGEEGWNLSSKWLHWKPCLESVFAVHHWALKIQHTLQQLIMGQTSNRLEQRNHGSPASPSLLLRKALCAPRTPVGLPRWTITTPGAENASLPLLPSRNSSPFCISFPFALLPLLTKVKWLLGYMSTWQLTEAESEKPCKLDGAAVTPWGTPSPDASLRPHCNLGFEDTAPLPEAYPCAPPLPQRAGAQNSKVPTPGAPKESHAQPGAGLFYHFSPHPKLPINAKTIFTKGKESWGQRH